MEIRFANSTDAWELTSFFEKYIEIGNDAVPSEEYFCPFGLRAALQKNNVIICIFNGQIVGGLRFYPRKRDAVVSLYQFAIDEQQRGKKLLVAMLHKTGYHLFETACPIHSQCNAYYRKTGWFLKSQDEKVNYWRMEVSLV